jgi:hypothetical protein
MQLSMWMAVGSVPAAVGGVYVLTLLEKWAGRDFEDLLLEILAVALLLTGAATLVRAFLKRMHERERDTIEMELRHKIAAVVLGVCVGFVLGITSAGSGALIAVGLILLFRLSPTRVVGTDVFHAAILLWAAGLAHIVAGNVDFFLAANILIGSVPGVWLGSHWSVRVQPGVLRATLALVLIGAGLALLIKAGLDVPVWILVPFPLGVIALMVVTMLRARAARAARATLEAREAALAAAAAHTPKRASTPPVGGRAGP